MATTYILIAHHLTNWAELEPCNAEHIRGDSLKYINEAIDILRRVIFIFIYFSMAASSILKLNLHFILKMCVLFSEQDTDIVA